MYVGTIHGYCLDLLQRQMPEYFKYSVLNEVQARLLVGHGGPYALRRALHGARPPGLVLVREPDQLGLERAHPQLALGARLVELAEAECREQAVRNRRLCGGRRDGQSCGCTRRPAEPARARERPRSARLCPLLHG